VQVILVDIPDFEASNPHNFTRHFI